jgi:hypothetical protein
VLKLAARQYVLAVVARTALGLGIPRTWRKRTNERTTQVSHCQVTDTGTVVDHKTCARTTGRSLHYKSQAGSSVVRSACNEAVRLCTKREKSVNEADVHAASTSAGRRGQGRSMDRSAERALVGSGLRRQLAGSGRAITASTHCKASAQTCALAVAFAAGATLMAQLQPFESCVCYTRSCTLQRRRTQ